MVVERLHGIVSARIGLQNMLLSKGWGFIECRYLGASPTAAGPQTGMGLPNGLRQRKFRSSEIPVFRIFDKLAENTNFLRGFLKNSLVESVPGEHTQLFTEGFPVIFHEGPFSSWNHIFSC